MVKNLLYLILGIAVIAGIFVFLNSSKYSSNEATPTPLPADKNQSLGEEISNQIKDPSENIPETNPFLDAKTNPYENSYSNPFK